MTPAAFGVDDPAPPSTTDSVVAIGNFDGVHLGHHRLIAVLRSEARKLDVPAVAICLFPHPLSLLRPESVPATLLWPERRAHLLRAAGVDVVAFLETTSALLALSAEEFFNRVLVEKLGIRGLVEGENFRFGKGRRGDVSLLKRLCNEVHVPMTSVSLTDDEESAVSSTRIRDAVATGDLRTARDLSGRRHRIRGTVGIGARRGRTVGFPTANLEKVLGLVPGHGVYSAIARFDDGRAFTGACNIGPNPTFGELATKIEIHLVDFSEDVYGAAMEVEFVERIRDVQAFAGVDELVRQIRTDLVAARNSVQSLPPEPLFPELATTIAEWVRWETAPSLREVGVSLQSAEFAEPGVIRLDWRFNGAPTPNATFDLLFGLEERLRRVFPEVAHVVSSTIATH